jgi:archaellum component FlaC
MNSSSSSYTISSTSTVSVEMDVGTIYFRGEVAEFYALITQNGRPFDATATTARLFGPGGLVQDLSGAVTKIETGIFKIDYTVPGNAAPGTYALVVNASKTISGVSSFGSNIRAFEVSQTFGKMNATLTAINGSIASITLDTSPILLRLDQINASISSISTSKGEIIAQISTTAGIITSKLDLIGASISSIENRIATIQTSLGSSNVDLATIDAKIDSLRGDMAHVSSVVGALNVSLSNLNPELTAIIGNVLTLQTDLGALDVKFDDLEARSIEVENGLVRIETGVRSIIMALNNFTGIAIPMKTMTGLRMSTLFTDIELTSVEYRESEQAISLSCNRGPQSQGKISLAINKELLNLIGSSTSNMKLLDNGQETSFSILELPNAYILQTLIDQGPHQLVLYLNGLPSIFSNLWLYLYAFIALGGSLVGGFFMMRRKRGKKRGKDEEEMRKRIRILLAT